MTHPNSNNSRSPIEPKLDSSPGHSEPAKADPDAYAATASQFNGNDKLLCGLILGVITFWLFAQTTLNIGPDMGKDLKISASTMNIAVAITALFSGIFIVVMGGVADRVGRVRIVNVGLYLSIVGSLLVGLTPPGMMASGFLLGGRILQGLSGACIMPASLALVKAYWSGARRQRAVSLWSIGSWGGSGFCSLFGGLVAQHLGWRYIFFASAVVAILGLMLVHGTPESRAGEKRNEKLDLAGVITFMVAMVALQVVATQGNRLGWSSPSSLLLIAVAIIFGIALFSYFQALQLGDMAPGLFAICLTRLVQLAGARRSFRSSSEFCRRRERGGINWIPPLERPHRPITKESVKSRIGYFVCAAGLLQCGSLASAGRGAGRGLVGDGGEFAPPIEPGQCGGRLDTESARRPAMAGGGGVVGARPSGHQAAKESFIIWRAPAPSPRSPSLPPPSSLRETMPASSPCRSAGRSPSSAPGIAPICICFPAV